VKQIQVPIVEVSKRSILGSRHPGHEFPLEYGLDPDMEEREGRKMS